MHSLAPCQHGFHLGQGDIAILLPVRGMRMHIDISRRFNSSDGFESEKTSKGQKIGRPWWKPARFDLQLHTPFQALHRCSSRNLHFAHTPGRQDDGKLHRSWPLLSPHLAYTNSSHPSCYQGAWPTCARHAACLPLSRGALCPHCPTDCQHVGQHYRAKTSQKRPPWKKGKRPKTHLVGDLRSKNTHSVGLANDGCCRRPTPRALRPGCVKRMSELLGAGELGDQLSQSLERRYSEQPSLMSGHLIVNLHGFVEK